MATPPPTSSPSPLLAPSSSSSSPLPPSASPLLVSSTTMPPPLPPSASWDPEAPSDWDTTPASCHCLNRIKRDLATIYREPPPGMFVVPDREDMTKVHAMIIGPFDTPYEGGFFHFLLRCPPNYPINPPRVKLLTTGDNTVRFNPNFYRNGKVCLSILGTWSGPSWSPALSLSSLLISIQSMMTDKPYHNEPGFETERCGGEVRRYNLIIQHETLRVAVLGNLSRWAPATSLLYKPAAAAMPDFIEHFEALCAEHRHRDGEDMRDPFGERRGQFQWGRLLEGLQGLREEHPQWFLLAEDGGEGEHPTSDVSELSDN